MRFLLLLLLPLSLFAFHGTTEVRITTFYPSSSLVRKIYGTNKIGSEIESSFQLHEGLSVWLNTSYLKCHGHSEGLKDKTSLELLPLSAGLKYTYPLTKWLKIAFGSGISFTSLTVRDHSELLQQKIKKSAWGGVAKSALIYNINEWLFADLFVDYYYTKIHSSGHSRQIGGLHSGLGLGVAY